MFVTKIKSVLVFKMVLGFVAATGATIPTCRTAVGQDDKTPATAKPVPVEPGAKQEEKAFTTLSKEDADPNVDQKPRATDEIPSNEQLTKTLLALDKQLWDAAKTGDWKVADRLLAKDFIGYSALYGRIDRTANVEGVKNRAITESRGR